MSTPKQQQPWADDVAHLLDEAFGELDADAAPRPTSQTTTQPYRLEDLITALLRTSPT